jgi:hypothetical protein
MAQYTGRKANGGKWVPRRWLSAALLPAVAGLLAGCAPDDFAHNQDPLLGGGSAIRPTGPTIAAGPTQPAPQPGVPPLPATSPSGSPAALASAGRGTLDPNRPELRMGGDTAAPAWGVQGGASPGVALQPPQPLAGSGGAVPLQPKPTPDVQLTGNTTAPTYQQLKAQLLARGVSVINITTKGEEVTLTCFVPLKDNQNAHQRYDAKGRDELAAMQAVLDQIDKKR